MQLLSTCVELCGVLPQQLQEATQSWSSVAATAGDSYPYLGNLQLLFALFILIMSRTPVLVSFLPSQYLTSASDFLGAGLGVMSTVGVDSRDGGEDRVQSEVRIQQSEGLDIEGGVENGEEDVVEDEDVDEESQEGGRSDLLDQDAVSTLVALEEDLAQEDVRL